MLKGAMEVYLLSTNFVSEMFNIQLTGFHLPYLPALNEFAIDPKSMHISSSS